MESIHATYGAALCGLVFGSWLYGITVLQTFSYFSNYRNDNKYTKASVVILLVLDTLHVLLCTRTVYWYLLSNFGNVDNLDIITWSMAVQTDCNGLIGLIVQVYFSWRVWKMSRNFVLTGVIIIFALVHFGLGVVFTVQSFILGRYSMFDKLTWVTCVGLGSAAIADVLIAVSMFYYLRNKRTGLQRRSNSVVAILMAYSINTGLLTSILATFCVVLFALMPTNFVWLAFFWILGKCYVNSFLALLNSRESLREAASVQTSKFMGAATFTAAPVRKPRKKRRESSITVQIETECRVDYSHHTLHARPADTEAYAESGLWPDVLAPRLAAERRGASVFSEDGWQVVRSAAGNGDAAAADVEASTPTTSTDEKKPMVDTAE